MRSSEVKLVAKPDFANTPLFNKFGNPADSAFNNAPVNTSDAEPEIQKKSPKRTFEGKQHIHLIIPDDQAEALKHMAKIQNLSVNKLMQKVLTSVIEEWKPALDQLDAINKKCAIYTNHNTEKKLI